LTENSDKQVSMENNTLNNRPRKSLGFKNPMLDILQGKITSCNLLLNLRNN